MAVFTEVTVESLSRWLAGRHPGLGRLTALTPIAQGIENTNYFVDTEAGRFVLTLLERTAPAEVGFPIALMKHLAGHGVRCPEPQTGLDGSLWAWLEGKPATLASRLPGHQFDRPDATACRALGALLARMHLAAVDFAGPIPVNPRGLAWWPRGAADVAATLTPAARDLLAGEIAFQQAFAASPAGLSLPRSAVHADLFRDNALFDASGQPGVIDFYFACEESWLFDLAVTVNDWCLADPCPADPSLSDPGIDPVAGPFDPGRLAALLAGYDGVRPLTPIERTAFPIQLRAAALRFWLSRLHDLAQPRDASLLAAKDPSPFEALLRVHRQVPVAIPAI